MNRKHLGNVFTAIKYILRCSKTMGLPRLAQQVVLCSSRPHV